MENVSQTAISSSAAHTVTPKAEPFGAAGGKVGPDVGKISPAQTANIAALNLDQVVQQLNIANISIGRALRFQVNVESGLTVIQVLDRDTGELIRQIPPDETIALTKRKGASEIQILDDLV